MKKVLLLGSLILIFNTQAQSVINGSFETNTASLTCNYNLSNNAFNGLVSNVTAYGVYEATDLVVNTCFVNNIPDGNFAVSLANNAGANWMQGEAISIELDVPLIIGTTYEISLEAAGIDYSSVTEGDLLIGVSTSPTDFGNLVDTAVTVLNIWNSYSFVFTALQASSV